MILGRNEDLSSRGSLTSAMRLCGHRYVIRSPPGLVPQGSIGGGHQQRQLRCHRHCSVRGVAVGAWVLLLLIPLLPIIITVAVIRTKLRRGQRTADGRAVCDQVEGFKTYLATAEADQLQFEEGEDIFSKYGPGRSSSSSPTVGRRFVLPRGDGPAARRRSLLVRRELPPSGLQYLLPHQ